MTKQEIYTELRELGYAKAKALKLAHNAEPFITGARFFYFYDRKAKYVVNADSKFIMRFGDGEPASGWYREFWEVVCA